MTGPKSRSTGAGCADSAARNFGKAFDPTTGSSPVTADTPLRAPAWVGSRRFPPHLRMSDSMGPELGTTRPIGNMPGAVGADIITGQRVRSIGLLRPGPYRDAPAIAPDAAAGVGWLEAAAALSAPFS